MRLIVVDNFADIAGHFAHAAEAVKPAVLVGMAAHAPIIEQIMIDSVRNFTPVGETGQLRDSTEGHTDILADGALVSVDQPLTVPWRDHGDTPLAWFIIEGTAEHPIDAHEGGPPLHWVGGSLGPGDHFARHVTIPERPADDYVARAMEAASGMIEADIAIAGYEITEAVATALKL